MLRILNGRMSIKKDISSNSEVVTFSLDTNGLSEGKYIIRL
jgi:hypothetical protein